MTDQKNMEWIEKITPEFIGLTVDLWAAERPLVDDPDIEGPSPAIACNAIVVDVVDLLIGGKGNEYKVSFFVPALAPKARGMKMSALLHYRTDLDAFRCKHTKDSIKIPSSNYPLIYTET